MVVNVLQHGGERAHIEMVNGIRRSIHYGIVQLIFGLPVDNALLWRNRARVMKLMEYLDEASSEAIESRPERPDGKSSPAAVADISGAVDKACHIPSMQLWDSFTKCKEDKVCDARWRDGAGERSEGLVGLAVYDCAAVSFGRMRTSASVGTRTT